VEDFRTCPIGISKLSLSQIDALRTAVLQKIQVRISRPLDNIFDNLKFIHLPETSRAIARMGISSILRNFALDDVWAYGLGDRNSPFAFFTTCMLEHRGIDSSRLTDFLIETDPIAQLLSTIKSSEIDERNVENTDIDTHVDLSFSEIDPKKLVARTFVAQECDKRNVSESLSKTEEAEKMHQGMLKDISLFLKSQGIIPFQSASIDLVYWVEEKTYFYEIKSATPENILAQAAKGAFQIACYSREMDADYSSVHSALILQKIDDLRLEIFVKKTLGYLGIKCLFYDRGVAWPNRVDGLLSGC
jgi:hypothetical protein